MNKIVIDTHTWTDDGTGDGKLLDGSFYVCNSLAQDELDTDTLSFTVRYPLSGGVDTSILNYPYGTACQYYQKEGNNWNMFG